MKKIDVYTVMKFGGLILTAAGTVLQNTVKNKELDDKIAKAVEEALAKRSTNETM